jgi:hypothetical protein
MVLPVKQAEEKIHGSTECVANFLETYFGVSLFHWNCIEAFLRMPTHGKKVL